MTYSEVLPTLRTLNYKDKIRVIQFLANEVAQDEETFFKEDETYHVWSPFESGEAAQQLRTLIEEQERVNA